MAERFGQPFMPWQRMVSLVGGELVEDPVTGLLIPAYREVIVTVNRQSGKTTLVLGWQVQRCIGWQHLGPQRVAYSAQTGNDARKKLVEDQIPILTPHKMTLGIRRFLKGMGNEAVEFGNGSRIVLLASAEDSGHGKTIDLGVKDEFFADHDDRRDQALVPAMMTKAAAQELTTSTAGTAASVPLNAAIERGRLAVEQGLRTGTAYFEWSADPEADPDDPAVWWGCMPALGYTLSEHVVRHARQTLTLVEFRRAFLNIEDDRRGEPVIPASAWDAVGREPEESPLPSPVAMAVDVSPDRTSAIAAAASTGTGTQVEVIDHRPDTGWVAKRLVELRDRHRPTRIVLDPSGPAGSLLADLESVGVEVEMVSTRQHQQACGGLLGEIIEKTLIHTNQAPLNSAVDVADKRTVGDAWLWSRKSSAGDISPLVACTLARWAALGGVGEAVQEIDESNLSVW